MWTELLDEFERQEKEDKDRMTTMLETAIREELDCPEHYIDILRGSSFRPGDILKLSVKDTPVRVSSGVSIRKHTLCQIPYYHTHDFYELIYVYQGNAGQYLPGGGRVHSKCAQGIYAFLRRAKSMLCCLQRQMTSSLK